MKGLWEGMMEDMVEDFVAFWGIINERGQVTVVWVQFAVNLPNSTWRGDLPSRQLTCTDVYERGSPAEGARMDQHTPDCVEPSSNQSPVILGPRSLYYITHTSRIIGDQKLGGGSF